MTKLILQSFILQSLVLRIFIPHSFILQSFILHSPSDHYRHPLKSRCRQLLGGIIPHTVGQTEGACIVKDEGREGREDLPVAGSCVSCSEPHCLWHVLHVPHVIPAWQTQSTFELTSTASPQQSVLHTTTALTCFQMRSKVESCLTMLKNN